MNGSKATDLVQRYSHHTRQIKALGKKIFENLDLCNGPDGDRLAVKDDGSLVHDRDTDKKCRDMSVHLWDWYHPEVIEETQYTDGGLVYQKITAEEHGAECPHCYAAHMAIQERKAHRRKLGTVKAAMTKGGAA